VETTDLMSVRRKADRAAMASQAAHLAFEFGLTVVHQIEEPDTRRTSVDVAGPHGLKVTVKFDGLARDPEIFLLSWHGVEDGWRLHPGMFGNVNDHHGRKATDVARGFAQLTRILGERFAVIADGTAFKAESEA
jgi:hypothetical protein